MLHMHMCMCATCVRMHAYCRRRASRTARTTSSSRSHSRSCSRSLRRYHREATPRQCPQRRRHWRQSQRRMSPRRLRRAMLPVRGCGGCRCQTWWWEGSWRVSPRWAELTRTPWIPTRVLFIMFTHFYGFYTPSLNKAVCCFPHSHVALRKHRTSSRRYTKR